MLLKGNTTEELWSQAEFQLNVINFLISVLTFLSFDFLI